MPDKKATIVVTGSGGFIGQATCRAFVTDGYEVIGFERPDAIKPQPGVSDIPCDVTSEQSVADAVSRLLREFSAPIASVIHLAAHHDFSGEPSPLYHQVNVEGTERLLRLLKTASAAQFLYSSTMLVHAPCDPNRHIDENWPLEPKWDYPESKLQAERLIHAQHDWLPVVLLRIAGVYTERCQSVPLSHQMQRIYEHRLTAKVFPGDTSHGQALVHLDDVVAAFRAAVTRRATLPREAIVLIGEPDPISYDQLQRRFALEIHGETDWTTTQIPKAVAKAGAWVQDQIPGIEEPFIKPWMVELADDHYALNISRAAKLLDWSPAHHLRDNLSRMVGALKSDPEGFYRLNKLGGAPPGHEAAASMRVAPRTRDV